MASLVFVHHNAFLGQLVVQVTRLVDEADCSGVKQMLGIHHSKTDYEARKHMPRLANSLPGFSIASGQVRPGR